MVSDPTVRLTPPRVARRVLRDAGFLLRRLTAAQRVLPGFVVVGAQKAGTTSLYHYLGRHPAVHALERKEVHYFDNHHERRVGWYRAHFPRERALARLAAAHGGLAYAGEATPFYMFHPLGPARMAAILPNARCIVLLRDPVARAYSHYQHERRNGVEQLSFPEALRAEPDRLQGELAVRGVAAFDDPASHQRHASYVTRGRYAEQLERLFAHFPRERVLVLFSDDLFANPQGTLERAFRFLDLQPVPIGDVVPRNAGRYDRRAIPLEDELRDGFQPHDRALEALLGVRPPWRG